MTIRLIFAAAADKFTFVLSASRPPTEEVEVSKMKAERERDARALMAKLKAICVPPGEAFRFPFVASSA